MTDLALAPNTDPAPSRDPLSPTPPSPRVRTAWLIVGSFFAVGLLVFGTISVVDVLAHERRTEVTTYDDVAALLIDGGSGAIDLRADDVDQVTVTATVSDGLRATGVSQRIDDGRLVLRSTCPNIGGTWCSVDWDVVVPAGMDVTVRSDRDGADLAGEFGAVDLRSENDDVAVDGAVRSVVARSENGNVTVRLGTPPDSVIATSENGDVTVVVPDVDEGYRVEVDTDNGSTETGVRTDPGAARTIEARSENGDVAVRAAP